MSLTISPGTTSVSVDVQIVDDSGVPVTGLVAATFPAVSYSKGSNAAATSITLSDLAAITTAHPNDNTAGGVKERSGGYYRLDLPNNAVSSACVLTLIGETTDKRLVAPRINVRDAKLASDGLDSAFTAAILAKFLTTDTGTTSASAVEGSVAKETADLVAASGGLSAAQQAQLTAIKAQTDLISSANVSVMGALAGGTHIQMTQGDTFPSTEDDPGTALTITKASTDDWPDDLNDGWTITWSAELNTDQGTGGSQTTISKACTVVDALGSDQSVRVQNLSASQSALLYYGNNAYNWNILATKSGVQVSLRRGTMTVFKKITAS